MSDPYFRYPLDPTGTNPDNLVENEVKTLSVNPVRPACPLYGPMFGDGVVVRDHISNTLLVQGSDWQFIELFQTPTNRFGKEIYRGIIILNPAVNSEISITYQALGGDYQRNDENMLALWDAFINDERTVDWVNISNRPSQFPPSLHNHLLSDVFGFGAVVAEIERVRMAITLGNVPAFEELITWVKARTLEAATIGDIDAGVAVSKSITLETLLYALKKFSFNTVKISPSKTSIPAGSLKNFNVETTNMDDGTILYWSITHGTTNTGDFTGVNGSMVINDNKASFNVGLTPATETEIDETFKVSIRRNNVSGPIIAETNTLTIPGAYVLGVKEFLDTFNECCIFGTDIPLTAETAFLIISSK